MNKETVLKCVGVATLVMMIACFVYFDRFSTHANNESVDVEEEPIPSTWLECHDAAYNKAMMRTNSLTNAPVINFISELTVCDRMFPVMP